VTLSKTQIWVNDIKIHNYQDSQTLTTKIYLFIYNWWPKNLLHVTRKKKDLKKNHVIKILIYRLE